MSISGQGQDLRRTHPPSAITGELGWPLESWTGSRGASVGLLRRDSEHRPQRREVADSTSSWIRRDEFKPPHLRGFSEASSGGVTEPPTRRVSEGARLSVFWQSLGHFSLKPTESPECSPPLPPRTSIESRCQKQIVVHRCHRFSQMRRQRGRGCQTGESSPLPSESVAICEICVPILCHGREVPGNRRWALTRYAMCHSEWLSAGARSLSKNSGGFTGAGDSG